MTRACAFHDPDLHSMLAALQIPRRALFLDRDGVMNVNHGYVHRPQDTDWVPGIFDFCRAARDDGFLLVVVTNQAGIARGYYTSNEFLEYTAWMHAQFKARGVGLAATYYCPHHPDFGSRDERNCDCRKPAPGLLLQASEALEISLRHSVFVGDKATDMEAGCAAGVGTLVWLEETPATQARTFARLPRVFPNLAAGQTLFGGRNCV